MVYCEFLTDDDSDAAGCCPLHLAVYAGHAEAVEALLNAGADPSLVDCNMDTPLHIAARQGIRSQQGPY